MRDREFAVLDIPAAQPAAMPMPARVKKLEGGFFSIAGAAADANGKLYFIDRHQQRIYDWSACDGLTIERDNPLDPVNLAIDKSGNIIVLSSYGAASTVYAFGPGTTIHHATVLAPQQAQPRPGARFLLPANYWNNGGFRDQLNFETLQYRTFDKMFREEVTTPRKNQYVSPDGSAVLPDTRVAQQGPPDHRGWRFSANLDAYGFISAAPGDRVYVGNCSEDITYSATVTPEGALTDRTGALYFLQN